MNVFLVKFVARWESGKAVHGATAHVMTDGDARAAIDKLIKHVSSPNYDWSGYNIYDGAPKQVEVSDVNLECRVLV